MRLYIFAFANHQFTSHHHPVITCILKSVNFGCKFHVSTRKIHTATELDSLAMKRYDQSPPNYQLYIVKISHSLENSIVTNLMTFV